MIFKLLINWFVNWVFNAIGENDSKIDLLIESRYSIHDKYDVQF